MKIQTLIRALEGVPFYKVKDGQFFYKLDESMQYLTNPPTKQVLKKYDKLGGLDFPYDDLATEFPTYVNDKSLVKVVRKTDKLYKEYVRTSKELLDQWNELVKNVRLSDDDEAWPEDALD